IIDRAPVMVTAPEETSKEKGSKNKNVKKDDKEGQFTPEDLEDYFFNPDQVIPRTERYIKNTYWAGESIPVSYPVSIFLVAILANYLGAPLKFIDKNTAWSEPIIEDWEQKPELAFNRENKWWLKSKKLLEAAAARARGKYYVVNPDLNGPGEILSRLRGEDKLAMDTIENKEQIKKSLPKINQAWYRYWQACNGVVHQHIGGYIFWMGIWSDIQAVDLQCDFSIMKSSDSFDELILPSIRQQTEWIQRTIYHLDGPGATRHLDSLLSLEKLDAIQWIPGAGAPPVSEWISLLKKIQEAGKLVYVPVEKDEVKILLKKLNPEGLLMKTRCESKKEADQLLADVKKWT
ncbi:MAG: hypothetical protein ACOC2O_02345, partial [Bacillota bacterium]